MTDTEHAELYPLAKLSYKPLEGGPEYVVLIMSPDKMRAILLATVASEEVASKIWDLAVEEGLARATEYINDLAPATSLLEDMLNHDARTTERP